MAEKTRASVTDWARELGLRVPIVCAPMGGVAGGALASAVSRAGALGMIGMGSAASPESLAAQLEQLDTGGAPFGVGFVGWGLERYPRMLEIALEAEPALISVSFLDWEEPPAGLVARVHRAGAQVVTQVATVDEARAAAAAGFDAVVARGLEAGGHGDHRQRRDGLLPGVLAAVGVPVLAGGAIASASDVRAVLDAGAAGAWVGTAFLLCPESLTPEAAYPVLLAAQGNQTVVSRVADVALGYPWPERFPERVLRTAFVERWQGREAELAADADARAAFREAAAAGDFSVVPLNAGTGVDRLTEVRSAAEVVRSLTSAG